MAGTEGLTGGSSAPSPDAEASKAEETTGPIGPFPTWGRLYTTVIVYGVGLILVLVILTRLLDPGTP